MAKVRNISTGPRGAYLKGVYVEAEKSQTIEADDYAEEWFEVVEGDEPEGGDAPELAKMTVADLKAFAEANAIDLADATKKDDILAAIELALEAKD